MHARLPLTPNRGTAFVDLFLALRRRIASASILSLAKPSPLKGSSACPLAHAKVARKYLLRQSHAPVASIALDVGYESEAAFNRAFKKFVGVPPGAWRKRRQSSIEQQGG